MGCVRGPDSWCPVPCHTQGRQLLGGFPLGVWGQVLSQPCVGHTSPLASLTSNPREVNPSPGISSVNLPVLWGSPSPWESSHGCCPCRGQDGKGGWMPTPWSRWPGGHGSPWAWCPPVGQLASFSPASGGTSNSSVSCLWALTSRKQLPRALWSLHPSRSTVLTTGVPSWWWGCEPAAHRVHRAPLVLGGGAHAGG